MKKLFRKIHLYIGLFTIPLGLIVGLTGVLSLVGFDKEVGEIEETYTINEIIKPGDEINFVKSWAQETEYGIPKLILTEAEDLPAVGTASYYILIEAKDEETELTVYKRNFYALLASLHEGSDKWYFQAFMALFGISFLTFYITGLYITVYHKTVEGKKVLRKEYVYTIVLGFITTITLAVMACT